MSQVAKWLCKATGAGLLAFVILNIFCILYYNIPVHYDNLEGSTDYVWEKGKFYSRFTEGFAFGVTDMNGYNNRVIPERIDYLIMGSSHMEAFNVAQNENTAALLQNFIYEAGLNETVYNIGISGHEFLRCARNVKAALKTYQPSKYVIIETSQIDFDIEQMKLVRDGEYPLLESHSDALIGKLQKFPYLRLLYSQLTQAMKGGGVKAKK